MDVLEKAGAKVAITNNGDPKVMLPQWQVQGAFAQDIWLVRPHAAQVPRTVQVFTQWLRKAFAPGFAPGLAPTSG